MPFLADSHIPIPNKDILSWIFEDATANPHKPIYVDANRPERSITRNQAFIIIRKLAAGFHAEVGAVFTGTNPAYTKSELAYHFKTARVRVIISEPELISNVLGASENPNEEMPRIWTFDSLGQKIPNGFASWKTLLKHGERDWVCFDNEEKSKSTTAARLFSSGTTGLPKATVLSHCNLIAQHTLVSEAHSVPYEVSRLLYLPMFHAATVPMSHIGPLRSSITSYIIRRFELELFLRTIDKYQITDVTLVPAVVVAIIKYSHIKNHSLQSLKVVIAGAAPLGKDNQLTLQRMLSSEARVTQVWGMTEATCIATTFRYPESDETGSVGRMLPNMDAKIIDEDGKDITAYDTTGEVCIRGPIMISHYFNNPTTTTESFDSEGYYKTGDVMYCSSESRKWYVIDRKKELIKVRGFQVAPAEIEGVLLTHSSISDAAVLGVQSKTESDVEYPRAYVVRSPEGTNLTEKEVVDYCKERLAKYKELTGGVRFLDVMPRNATGKLLKRNLRDMVRAEFSSQNLKL